MNKSKAAYCRAAAFFLFALFSCFFYTEQSMAGLYSTQGDNLLKALNNELMKQGVCVDVSMCSEMLWILRRDGKKIELSMYKQADTKLASKVVAFFVEKGIKITEGMPITLIVYPKSKTEYINLKYFTNDSPSLKLEIKNESSFNS